MMYTKNFIRLNWITLVFIYLVVIAGSFVRITGSGMGCPDWPKCFGQWVPPTTEATLPSDYKDIYVSKRAKKVDKFTRFLSSIGMKEIAEKIKKDKSLLIEQDFNARKTWTEYINRVFGVFAGFGVLFVFLQIIRKYRTKKLVSLATLNLFLFIVQAWFGSIVVATNLVPWTITIHLFLALVIIAIQLLLIMEISPLQQEPIALPKNIQTLLWITFGITFVQMFLGTQVREAIDALVKQGYSRAYWVEHLGIPFLIHRSFSWLVLGILGYLYWLNRKNLHVRIINTSVYLLVIELVTGVLLAYASMPGLVQTSHLLFASILFGTLFVTCLRGKKLI